MSEYGEFLHSKLRYNAFQGIHASSKVDQGGLFGFQKKIVQWSLERGRSALFLNTGTGKTWIQLAWAKEVASQAGDVLILAPLAVAQQTVGIGQEMGIPVTLCRKGSDMRPGINIANYERLHLFDVSGIVGIVLDESSVLKSLDSKTREQLIATFRDTPYRLCCTATPAPNDYMELGNHSEFLGIMTRSEMLSMFFTHDGGNTSQWRLKGHGQEHFWRWMASWALAMTHPREFGDDTQGFDLPPLERRDHLVTFDVAHEGLTLFPLEARGLQEQRAARRAGIRARVEAVAKTIEAEPAEQWLVWCGLNDEADRLERALAGTGRHVAQIAGADSIDVKEQRLLAFLSGETTILVTKASCCGFGLNLQRCARMAFVGVDNSFESEYQAIRRCWRFGQTRSVHVHRFYADIEQGIVRNLARKEREAAEMQQAMTAAVLQYHGITMLRDAYMPGEAMAVPQWLKDNKE